jgi:hypothetical protein
MKGPPWILPDICREQATHLSRGSGGPANNNNNSSHGMNITANKCQQPTVHNNIISNKGNQSTTDRKQKACTASIKQQTRQQQNEHPGKTTNTRLRPPGEATQTLNDAASMEASTARRAMYEQ